MNEGVKIINEQKVEFLFNKRSSNPKYFVFLLHGYGSNNERMLSYFNSWPEHYSFISINGLEEYEAVSEISDKRSYKQRQWFSLASTQCIFKKIRESSSTIARFIEIFAKEYNIKPENLLLFGFSQGGYLCMAIDEWLYSNIGCIVCMGSGINRFSENELLSVNFKNNQRYCLIHGLKDNIVDFSSSQRAKKFLESLNRKVSLFPIENLGHKVYTSSYRLIENCLSEDK